MTNKNLLMAASFFLLAACAQKEKKVDNTVEEVVSVSTSPVKLSEYVATFHYSGLMASATESRPSFKIGGIIARIYVKEGDKVIKGQLLASLDLTEINAQIEQAGKSIEKIKRDLSRVKNLYKDTAATLEQLQNVQTQLDVANETMRIALFNKQYAEIHAAANGTVIRKLMNEGELTGPGTPLFYITGNGSNDWVIRFGASDKDWASLKLGDAAWVNIDAYPDKEFKGVITKMAAAADPYSNTYEVEIKVLPGNERFAAGLFSKVRLQSAKKQKLMLVPIEAITEGDGKKAFVYTLNSDGKTVKKHAIEIAFIENEEVGVASGLEGMQEVITAGVSYLTENSVVKKVNKK